MSPRRIWPTLVCLLMLVPSVSASEQDESFWYLQTSLFTVHYSPEPDHNNRQKLIGVERHLSDASLWGAATFLHSFGERANYAYYGRRFDLSDSPYYLKLTGGLMEGYKGEYRDKIPLNRFGVAPVLVPSVGVNYQQVSAEVVVLGAAALMLTVGLKL